MVCPQTNPVLFLGTKTSLFVNDTLMEHCREFDQIAPSLTPRMKRAFEIRCPDMVAGFNPTVALAVAKPAAHAD